MLIYLLKDSLNLIMLNLFNNVGFKTLLKINRWSDGYNFARIDLGWVGFSPKRFYTEIISRKELKLLYKNTLVKDYKIIFYKWNGQKDNFKQFLKKKFESEKTDIHIIIEYPKKNPPNLFANIKFKDNFEDFMKKTYEVPGNLYPKSENLNTFNGDYIYYGINLIIWVYLHFWVHYKDWSWLLPAKINHYRFLRLYDKYGLCKETKWAYKIYMKHFINDCIKKLEQKGEYNHYFSSRISVEDNPFIRLNEHIIPMVKKMKYEKKVIFSFTIYKQVKKSKKI